ncbi:MAG: VOC family protein [Putridiphycobacter sp.]
MSTKGKVTGIGGVFFKSANPKETKEWYANNLGLKVDDYGATFQSRDLNNADQITHLQWSPFNQNTEYFKPSDAEFMINYRVENIEAFVEELKSKGVTICDEIESFEYGKFVHILDQDGRKIELWEPVDQVFTDQLQD